MYEYNVGAEVERFKKMPADWSMQHNSNIFLHKTAVIVVVSRVCLRKSEASYLYTIHKTPNNLAAPTATAASLWHYYPGGNQFGHRELA